ncbi:MAG TPA: universal stress protein [Methylomirabilota bacterium]|nr:universal stress protein [Methylomirabilota bacterium]
MSAPGFYRIIVPVDFSDASEEAWTLALKVAALSDAELVLVHVVPESPFLAGSPLGAVNVAEVMVKQRHWAERELAGWVERARAEGCRARIAVRPGVPHAEILAAATDERADLIVIGTHGRGGFDRALLGSVADRVIRLAPCPVLSTRPAS